MTDAPIPLSAPAAIADSSLAAYAWDTYSDVPEHVIYLSSNNGNTHVYELWYAPATGTWPYQDLTALTGAPNAITGSTLAGYVWPGDTSESEHVIHLVNVNGDTHIYELWFSQETGMWYGNDLTTFTGAPDPAAGSALAGYAWDTDSSQSEHVIYLDNNNNIYDLWYSPDNRYWSYTNLTIAAGAPNAIAGSAIAGYTWSDDTSEHVIYLGNNNGNIHVYELWQKPGAGWVCNDLTIAAGAPDPVAESALIGYTWTGDTSEHVIYMGNNNDTTHIYELRRGLNNKWTCYDLTALTGAPDPAVGSALTGYTWAADTSEHVIYLDNNNNVYDLSCTQGGSWIYNNLTTLTGAPNAVAGSALAGFAWDTGKWEHIIYLGNNNGNTHVYDLRLEYDIGSWNCYDLTANASSGSYNSSSDSLKCDKPKERDELMSSEKTGKSVVDQPS